MRTFGDVFGFRRRFGSGSFACAASYGREKNCVKHNAGIPTITDKNKRMYLVGYLYSRTIPKFRGITPKVY
jgi:hypothetical protein